MAPTYCKESKSQISLKCVYSVLGLLAVYSIYISTLSFLLAEPVQKGFKGRTSVWDVCSTCSTLQYNQANKNGSSVHEEETFCKTSNDPKGHVKWMKRCDISLISVIYGTNLVLLSTLHSSSADLRSVLGLSPN